MHSPERAKPIEIQVVNSVTLSPSLREEIIALCNRAYEEDLEPLFETFTGAVHLLGYCESILVSHALWVRRYLQAGTGPLMRTAYVEALATEAGYRGRGYAAALLKTLIGEVQAYDLAALSPSDAGYYRRLDWELWRGPLFIRENGSLLPSPDDEEVMIYRLPKTPALDINDPLSAEWREGELW